MVIIRLRAGSVAAALIVAACSTDSGTSPAGSDSRAKAGESVETSSAAAAALARFSSRFALAPVARAARIELNLRAPSPLLRASVVDRFERRDGCLIPIFHASSGPTTARARVSFPASARGAFTVHDEGMNLGVSVTLAGAIDSPAEVASGHVLYRGAYGAGDVVHQAAAEGDEDFVVFEVAPAEPVVRYVAALGERVAGLRLVSNTLELLDAQGAPRLRVAPPYLVDAAGHRHAARLAVDGCAVDTNPAVPYHRPVTPPGAVACTVVVSWEGASVQYPAVLDPAWGATGSMASPRYLHTATLLATGRVLVAGGE
jgi:hypothetical protein